MEHKDGILYLIYSWIFKCTFVNYHECGKTHLCHVLKIELLKVNTVEIWSLVKSGSHILAGQFKRMRDSIQDSKIKLHGTKKILILIVQTTAVTTNKNNISIT